MLFFKNFYELPESTKQPQNVTSYQQKGHGKTMNINSSGVPARGHDATHLEQCGKKQLLFCQALWQGSAWV